MMKPALILAAFFALAAPAAAQEGGMTGMDHGAHGDGGAASKAYMDAMTRMDGAMRGTAMTGKAGMDFAVMMIPHHQAAIDMAKAYLASGDDDPKLVAMANAVVAAQESEIAELKAWIAANGGK